MEFAGAVQDRFNNPFVDHELMSISLNSTSKWRARNLPSLLDYIGLDEATDLLGLKADDGVGEPRTGDAASTN